ncbi:unnamed protein product [Periconia digitata]|uniref:FAD/NAD(P)-binding domain-containing protein n=1 Tax=Periconia digitata TaxID=1303443 RepID=A0A9W4XIZ5_9PLEO|nr:unnamed protein product [Periconia digitata]
MTEATHEIVVVGGNLAGVQISHYLLRKTIPALQATDKHQTTAYHLTLISPNTHLFYKIAAPRALINPTLIPTEKIFKPLTPAFQQYGESFEYLQGEAVDLDITHREVVARMYTARGGERRVKYDSLVIATGASTTSPLWSFHGGHGESVNAFRTLYRQLPEAESIVIAGGGPVGVETAGEIASAYPDAKVTLVGGEAGYLLPREKVAMGLKAEDMLEDLGVDVKLGVKLSDANASSITRPIPLSDGTFLSPSVFINATGPRIYNTSWLPPAWLDDSGQVLVRDAYFRVQTTSTSISAKNVYVIGDAAAGYKRTAMELDAMVPTVASSIAIDIMVERKLASQMRGSSLNGLMGLVKPFKKPYVGEQIDFKPARDTMMVSIGPKGGVGVRLGWGVPSWMVKKEKAERFCLELVDPLVDGTKFD